MTLRKQRGECFTQRVRYLSHTALTNDYPQSSGKFGFKSTIVELEFDSSHRLIS
jgi:hypothetical protein